MNAEPKTFLSQPRIMATAEFIERNNLKLRSEKEVAEKINAILEERSILDFRPEVLIYYLPLDSVKSYLNDEYVEAINAGRASWRQIIELEECCQDFLDYMNFAWGKAEDERGISAERSIQKLSMWLWLMNREDLQYVIEDDSLYNPYGAPALIEVCNSMGITVPDSLIAFSKVNL